MQVNPEEFHDLKNDFILVEQALLMIEHSCRHAKCLMAKIRQDYFASIEYDGNERRNGERRKSAQV